MSQLRSTFRTVYYTIVRGGMVSNPPQEISKGSFDSLKKSKDPLCSYNDLNALQGLIGKGFHDDSKTASKKCGTLC
jgi:hypothetical protein